MSQRLLHSTREHLPTILLCICASGRPIIFGTPLQVSRPQRQCPSRETAACPQKTPPSLLGAHCGKAGPSFGCVYDYVGSISTRPCGVAVNRAMLPAVEFMSALIFSGVTLVVLFFAAEIALRQCHVGTCACICGQSQRRLMLFQVEGREFTDGGITTNVW